MRIRKLAIPQRILRGDLIFEGSFLMARSPRIISPKRRKSSGAILRSGRKKR
jgi:hypothetical protein